MMSGGIPAGESALFVGPSGSGKSLFARHFIAAGAEAGEPGIIAVFEEHPGEYLARASAFGPELASLIERGLVEVLYLRPLDLTVDEALAAVREAVERKKARGVVDRFVLRVRARARALVSRRLPRVALPHDHRRSPGSASPCS